MSAADKVMALGVAAVVALIATAIFWVIKAMDDDANRNDQLQQQCIARGGNWDYGCEMRPK